MGIGFGIARRSCARCGRDAFYLLRASGEPLCARCFERAVVKAIRRAIGGYRVLNPGDRLLVVEPLKIPLWFWISMKYLARSLKSHGNRIALLSYRGYKGVFPKGDIYVVDIDVDRKYIVDLCRVFDNPIRIIGCLLKAEYILGFITSKSIGINVSALIRPRDLCSLIGFLGIAYMDFELAVESQPLRRAGDVITINPIYNLASIDLTALAFLSNQYVFNSYGEAALGLDRIAIPGVDELTRIYSHSPEIMYSSSEAVRKILSGVERKCSICGAPISSGDLCSMCSYLYPLLKHLPNTRR
ncbi:MAG: hypothetical protein QXQ57_02315 [Sulfolobales archaeon]